ncbi:MAG TPA: hypothetical protein VFW47_16705 [Phenylobacterium sp.]|nr:hypothetical protein [Phenylobacterium sp.]
MASSTKSSAARRRGRRADLRAAVAVGLSLLAGPACAGGGPPSALDFPQAVAAAGCTQEDLPALTIRLTSRASRAEIVIEIAGIPRAFEGARALTLSPLRRDLRRPTRDLARGELSEPGRPSVWLTGAVTLRRVQPGHAAAGAYDLRTPDGRRIKGAFDAGWAPGAAACG